MIIALEKESLGHTHVEIDLEEGAPYRILEGALWKRCILPNKQ